MDELVSALESAARGEPLVEPAKTGPVVSNTMAQQFSTSEVHEVLSHAIERQAATQDSVKLGFDDLIDIAAEVGVDVASLREASRALRRRDEEQLTTRAKDAKRDAWLQHQRLVFYRHAGICAIVNAALLVLGLLLLTFTPWWIWCVPALVWGAGLAIHALVVFTYTEQDWAEHNATAQWWLDNRQSELALAQGAHAIAIGPGARDASDALTNPQAKLGRVQMRHRTCTFGASAPKISGPFARLNARDPSRDRPPVDGHATSHRVRPISSPLSHRFLRLSVRRSTQSWHLPRPGLS